MGIKGLTGKGASFPEIGQIRKGSAKPENGKGPGRDLDYFRVIFDEQERDSVNIFKKNYGEKPQEINFFLPFNEIDRCFDAWLEAYTAGRMVARSDGEKFLYWVDTKTGEIKVKNGLPYTPYKEGQSVGSYTDGKDKEQLIYCAPVGRLKIVVRELRRLAYMTVMTTSKHDIANLDAQLEGLRAVNGGQISGIPLVLKRRPKKISVPTKNGKRSRYTKWMLSIEADPSWVWEKSQELQQLATPENHTNYAISAGSEEPIDVYLDEPEGFDPPSVTEIDPQPEAGNEQKDEETRPYAPEMVKAKIEDMAGGIYKDKTAKKEQKGLMVGMVETCFAEGDTARKRYAVCKYLTGHASSKKIQDSYVLALLKWLAPEQDDGGAYIPCADAIKEAQSIWTANLKEEGQQNLL